MTYPPMRPQIEIQRVHDMLMGVLADRRLVRAVIPDEYVKPLEMVADCVCWMLHHDVGEHADSHASDFAYILWCLKEDLDRVGWTLEAPPDGDYIVEE